MFPRELALKNRKGRTSDGLQKYEAKPRAVMIAHADFVVMEGQAAKLDLEDDNALEEDA